MAQKKGKSRKEKERLDKQNGWMRLVIGVLCFYFLLAVINDGAVLQWVQTNMGLPTITQTSTTIKEVQLDDELVVHYIDIGQGDSTLIEYKDFDMLIDGGDRKATNQLLAYLGKQKIDDFEYVVATHMDADHIGGLDDVIKQYNVEHIIDSGTSKKTKVYSSYVDAYQSKKIDRKEDSEVTLKIDEYLSITFIETGDSYKNENDNSVICQVTFGNMDFLFTGDMEKDAEEDNVRQFSDIDVLKVGHHGSATSSSDEFLARVSPEYAVISCGKNNKYGHPHKETLDRLAARQIPTYRTDVNGTIIIKSDGNKITVVE